MITRANPVVRFINAITNNGLEAFGKYYSKYRAFVFDNEDPQKMARLKLIIPQVTGNEYHDYWAYPCNVFSGDGYGSQVIPKKGDLVWVEFEGGHPEIPIWSHGHFSAKERPKDSEMDDVNCYWFKTPNGHIVKLNDTKSIIHIESSLGDIIEFNTLGISVQAKGVKRVSVKNDGESLKDIMVKMLTTYITTKTIDGKVLDPTSIQNGIDLIIRVNKLLY